jgi:hypothetical protein
MRYSVSPGESVSVAVVTAVADAENADPNVLPPLSEMLDTDALDAMFTPVDGTTTDGHGRITFEYSMSQVTIDGSDQITVEPAREYPLQGDA